MTAPVEPSAEPQVGPPAVEGVRTVSLVAVLIGLVIWFLPPPAGVEPRGWHLLAIFVATIIGIMVRAAPMSAIAIIGLAVTVLTGTLGVPDALSGFAHPVVWLVLCAFFVARGFIKTGLGARVAYFFMALLGKRSLGLAYGLVATDLFLSPAIPSNTARSGGLVFPILRSLARTLGSKPEDGTARRIGGFLTLTAYQATVVTSGMFITAMAANPLAVAMAGERGIEIVWGTWALAASVPGVLSLVLVPLLIYWLYPPEIKETPAAADIARTELSKMGSMKRDEWMMLGVFFLLLLLWSLGTVLGVAATAAALGGVGVLLFAQVLTWDDILREREAWNTMVWFAILVMMATYLGELGITSWFSQRVAGGLGGVSWVPAFLGLSLIYFYSHYFFASITAQVSAMYATFLGVALAVGTPPMLAALVLGFFSSLFSGITHYGTGAAPVLFGSGYVEVGTWWKMGALISLANIAIWLGVGSLWWKVLGLW